MDDYRISLDILTRSYLDVKKYIINKGFAWEIDWQEHQNFNTLQEHDFYKEAAWVILSSGMSTQSVSSIFGKISYSFYNWSCSENIVKNKKKCFERSLYYFNHPGKIQAIIILIEHIYKLGFKNFKLSLLEEGVIYLQQFKFLGPATSLHLAKNIGLNVVKPDRHLVRLAEALNFQSAEELCKSISHRIDEKVSVIDIVLWRYCVINPNYLSSVKKLKEYYSHTLINVS